MDRRAINDNYDGLARRRLRHYVRASASSIRTLLPRLVTLEIAGG